MWDDLYHHIENTGVVLSTSERAFLPSLFKFRKFRKNQYIIQQGDIVKYESFIIKGLTRTYTVDDKGHESVLSLSTENWWVGDLYSFFTDNPTNYNIDCLEDTEVLQITRQDMDILCLEVPKMNIYYRNLYRSSLIAYNKRIHSTLEKTALQRYQEFLEDYPQIEQRVPNHQIAAFLGITPQSLSRIRKQAFLSKK